MILRPIRRRSNPHRYDMYKVDSGLTEKEKMNHSRLCQELDLKDSIPKRHKDKLLLEDIRNELAGKFGNGRVTAFTKTGVVVY